MDELHESIISEEIIEPTKGQRELLCSNKDSLRCPFVGSINEEDQTLDCLAGILVEAFIKKKRDEFKNNKQQEGRRLLPSIN